MSDSPRLVDFAFGPLNSVLKLPDAQVKFFEELKLKKNCEINLLIKTFLGLVEMIFGLVNVSFSLPECQAVKMTFLGVCIIELLEEGNDYSVCSYLIVLDSHLQFELSQTNVQMPGQGGV